jgi:hypothetical protein
MSAGNVELGLPAVTRWIHFRATSGCITKCLYLPGQPWERIDRIAGPSEITAASSLRLSLEDDPVLVPLEMLAGRDHYRFPPGEEPPWRWSIVSRPSGRPVG